jgi:hypothetical protein
METLKTELYFMVQNWFVERLGPIVVYREKPFTISSQVVGKTFSIEYEFGEFYVELLQVWRLRKIFKFLKRRPPIYGMRITKINGTYHPKPEMQELIESLARCSVFSNNGPTRTSMNIREYILESLKFIDGIFQHNPPEGYVEDCLRRMRRDKDKLSSAKFPD